MLAAARRVLGPGTAGAEPLAVDYVSLVHPETFEAVGEGHAGPAVLAIAAGPGRTRLIDNIALS